MCSISYRHLRHVAFGLVIVSTLSACFHENDEATSLTPTKFNTIVATRAADYSSGAHSVITRGNSYQATNNLDAAGSDLLVFSYGEYLYRLGRFGMNNITKYHISTPDNPVTLSGGGVWQFKTQEDNAAVDSNPGKIVFVNETKAYLLRYGSNIIWIINPSANSQAELKTGEIDLSDYADSDGVAEIQDAILVNDQLIVLMERLVLYSPAADVAPYLAFFDINTNQEIDLHAGNEALKGLSLSIKNPINMVYLNSNNSLYIAAQGKLEFTYGGFSTPAEYSGGISKVTLSDHIETLLIDDGDDTSHPYGQFTDIEILNEERGYFVGTHVYGDANLYSFNPTTGTVDVPALLANKDIADIKLDPLGNLWVGNASDMGLNVFDTVTNTAIGSLISTDLAPINLDFITLSE